MKLANESKIQAIRTSKGLEFFLADRMDKDKISAPREEVRIQCTICQEYKRANGFIAIGSWNNKVNAFNTSFFICEDCQEKHLSNTSLYWLRKRLREYFVNFFIVLKLCVAAVYKLKCINCEHDFVIANPQ